MDVVGPYALPYQRDFDGRNEETIGPDYATEAAPMYFNYRKVSIYGGSNEIQRNIVAKAILGLYHDAGLIRIYPMRSGHGRSIAAVDPRTRPAMTRSAQSQQHASRTPWTSI